MKNKRMVVLSSVGIVLLVVATIGVAYAIFNYTKEGTTENTVTVGNIKFLYTEVSGVGNGISITDALPMSDTEGKAQTGEGKVFDFKVEANTPGGASIPYEITASKTDSSTLDESVVKVYLTEVNGSVETDTPLTSDGAKVVNYSNLVGTSVPSGKGKTIYNGEVPKNTTNYLKTFKVRMWIDEKADFSTGNYNGKSFTLKINVYANAATNNTPTATKPSVPELASNMIPVVYDEGTSNWVKADVNAEWYNYNNKKWANAVTISETNRATYMSSSAGTVIPMSDILQMLVWIPRYKYAIPAGTGPREISIQFEDKATAKSTGTATGTSYLTHPAFTFGDQELNGIWVGKFEMDGIESSLTIKPNEQSFANKTASEFFNFSRNMQTAGNIYGYSSTEIDTHMMKNSEWGAVSYLTQSKYGRCTAGVCEEVTINNINANSGRSITGCAADTVTASELVRPDCPETNRYQTERGVKASTTGNIYGIYDMSGGSWEYVMGNYNNYSGYSAISYTAEQASTILGRTDGVSVRIWNSGFNGPVYGKDLDGVTNLSWTSGTPFPEQKYYDLYTTNSAQTACNGNACLGHSVLETAGWYADSNYFLSSSSPWFVRGGRSSLGVSVGIFAFSNHYGSESGYRSFRLVVSAM